MVHVFRTEEREYVYEGPWSYVDKAAAEFYFTNTTGSELDPNKSHTVANTAILNDFTTWGYNQTFVSRSAIILQKEKEVEILDK